VQKQVDGRIAVLAWGMCVLALALIFVSLVLTLLGTSRIVGLDFPLVGVSGRWSAASSPPASHATRSDGSFWPAPASAGFRRWPEPTPSTV
jgi:hypothetical protein